jgi:carboxyl-terminal processing protease
MIRNISVALIVALVALQAGSAVSKPIRGDSQAVVLQPEPYLEEASKWATTFLTRAHYKKTRLNDELSAQMLDRYIESLDPNKVFLLESDIAAFEAYRNTLDDALMKQNLRPAFEIFNIYSQRVGERIAHAQAVLAADFDFDIDESLELDRSEAPYASSQAEIDELWRKRVKNDVLRLKLADKELDDIRDILGRRYADLERRVGELDSEDVFQYFMNAFATSIEPHTGYLAPRTSENFQISMRLSLEGIGAVLQRENEYTTVRRVVPGGPAYEQGILKEGDRIVGVSQGPDEESVDVIGWRLDDVVDLIRGPSGSTVRLDIIPVDAGLDAPSQTIALVRDKVKLEEQAAKKEIYEFRSEGKMVRIGVIDLPAFYLDFAARARREADYRSSTRDVRKLLQELKEAEVDGVIMDLRGNGGGSLAEATELTGLFIDSGPVVQVKDSNGKVDVEADTDQGVEWDGPFAVMVNRHSASASEIFAAAIQDYGRGVIIGEPTFGKGTVQNLINLNRYGRGDDPRYGQLKLTIAQFFRVNGGSTQHRGVIPDIVFPTLDETEDYGERSLDNALPWTSIKPARYELAGDLTEILPAIDERSSERLKLDNEFRFLMEDIRSYRETRDETQVSLLESARREEMRQQEDERKNRKAARDAWTKQDHPDSVVRVDGEPEPEAAVPEDEEDAEEIEAREQRGDILLDEAVRIVSDIISLSGERRTAQLTPKPDPVN